VVLPPAHEAGAWFVATARAAIESGVRLDAPAVELLISLAPGDPMVATAIEGVDPEPGTRNLEPGTSVAAAARRASAQLRVAIADRDEPLARATVTSLELEVLQVYRPVHGLGCFEDDVAVAAAMLDAYDIGGDETHLMMAEELLLGVLRRYWRDRLRHPVRVNCEAAVALARLAMHPGKQSYRDHALEVLHGYAGTYRALGLEAAPFVSALHLIS
jgi:hypothetical protein